MHTLFPNNGVRTAVSQLLSPASSVASATLAFHHRKHLTIWGIQRGKTLDFFDLSAACIDSLPQMSPFIEFPLQLIFLLFHSHTIQCAAAMSELRQVKEMQSET